ncbi:MotA/TolQ/ExbB proton channel family protein [bacterium]|nr:MotA/TolQ/ExbB proton channel family protein [bacterium]
MSLEIFTVIAKAFSNGGIWMWAILAVQAVSIAIIIERVVSLFVLRSPHQKKLVDRLENNIKKGELNKVIQKSHSFGIKNPIAFVAKAGAEAAKDHGGADEIQARMDEVLINENNLLEKRTGYLSMLGNVGTLLGLLGTIVGLIKAFSSIANANPIEKAEMLSTGISMAMNTTAYGLIMAIPALVMFSILQSRSNTLAEDLNQGSLKLYNLLRFRLDKVKK